jgi:hypothetical protein
MNCLPTLAPKLDPPDLCFPSSWDYRPEPPLPNERTILKNGVGKVFTCPVKVKIPK